MAELNVPVPVTSQGFYTDSQRSAIKSKMDDIYAKYGSQIDTVASLTNVPKVVITSFIFIESSGNPNAVSSAGAVGLMQLIPTSASDILVMENRKGRFSDGEKQILTQKLGTRFTNGILKMRYLGDVISYNGQYLSTFVNKQDLLDPLTNILIGAIYLGLLIDEHTEGSSVRFDKVVIRYNKGYFSDGAGRGLVGDINSMISYQPTESKNYVLKLLGKNGTLDTVTNLA